MPKKKKRNVAKKTKIKVVETRVRVEQNDDVSRNQFYTHTSLILMLLFAMLTYHECCLLTGRRRATCTYLPTKCAELIVVYCFKYTYVAPEDTTTKVLTAQVDGVLSALLISELDKSEACKCIMMTC